MNEKSCSIIFVEGKTPQVIFRGEWIRKDLDVAHHAMFKELPKYLVERRKLLEREESEYGTEKRGRKRN